MLVNNTIESSKRPGIPGPHRPDLKWFKDALDGKSDVGHVHQKKDITDFEHTHDSRYYRKDEHELQLLLSGNGTPNFNQGINGDYYVDELNGDLYKKSGDAWNLIIHLEGEQGIPGPQGNPGIRGPEGPTGKEGYTPVRGTDYWTPEDEEIIRQSIVSEVALGLSGKVDKVAGKGLSTEDFTTLLKQKLEELQNYDDRDIRELLEKALYNVTIDIKTGILTFHTIDESTFTVDLPLELIVSDGYLNKDTNTIVLVLANGNTIDIPVENLIKDFYSKSEVDQKIDNLAEEVAIDFETVDEKLAKAQVQIDTLKAENEAQQEEIDMLTADYRENTIEGETVAISDGLPKSKIKADVNGNSYQYSTKGYNNINSNELIGKKVSSVASTDANKALRFTEQSIKAGIEYTFKLALDNVDFTTSQFLLVIRNSSNTSIKTVLPNKTVTLTEDEIALISYIFLYYNGADNLKNKVITKCMLVESANVDKAQEKYTGGQASPNIEHPQEVEVVEGVNELQIDKEYWELTDNGIKNLYKNSSVLLGKEINLKANITYYINFVLLSRPTVSTTFVAYIDNVSNDSISAINIEVESRFTIGKVVTKSYTPTKDEVLTFKMWGNENGETFEFQYWVTTVPNAPYLPYGHIGLIQRGKNRFSIDKALLYDTPSITGVIEGNSISMSGNGTWGNYALLFENPKENTDISISADFLESAIAGKKGISIYGKNQLNKDANDLVVLKSVMVDVALNTKTRIENTANTGTYKYIYVRFWNNATATTLSTRTNCTVDNIQMELGEPTPFEPYIEPIVKPINLNGEKLAKVGNVKDLLNIGVDGRVSIEKKINEEIIAGTTSNISNFLLVTSTVGNDLLACVFNILDTLKSSKAIICNKFVTKTLGSVTDTGNSENVRFYEGIAKHNNYNEQYVLSVKKSRLQTEDLQGILDLLAEEQPQILYAIATPQTIPLPSIEPITLFEGTNVFELITNLGTSMAVTYKISNKKQLIENNDRITALEATVNTLLGGN